MHALNALFVMPRTLAARISYSEHLNPGGLQVDFFVSHDWNEEYAEFVQSTLRHAMFTAKSDWEKIVYWICTKANNQHHIDLGDDLEHSPFHLALKSEECKGTVLNLNSSASALTRAWCAYEAFLTTQLHKKFVVNTCQGIASEAADDAVGERDQWIILLFNLLQGIDIRQAKASKESDKVKIMKEVNKDKDGARKLNDALKMKIAEQAVAVLARRGHPELLDQALRLGANPDVKDHLGVPPLTYAVAWNQNEAAKILRKGGADHRAEKHASDIIGMLGLAAKGWTAEERDSAIKRVQCNAEASEFFKEALAKAQTRFLDDKFFRLHENLECYQVATRRAALEEALGLEVAEKDTAQRVLCLLEKAV
eukprot:CAMPEP_0198612860 /NCGR_PEP_ID=MMETSP1462-20131121/158106_1 /TAXON_ID=1333877 /ORGANISM="Brandtodinium nutriculum, Strain RCC3387" /LENGTH=366 /DNA_ID=CAMNT_0044344661 /DNA_START=80 /DNA_END=1177 /DNA_ORIENTATION=+